MLSNNKIIICIPVYNEENVIVKLIHELKSEFNDVDNLTFVFVDDGSTDKTYEVIEKNKTKNSITIKHERNYGIGACIYSVFIKYHKQYDYFISFPGNNKITTNSLRKIIEKLDINLDNIIVGSRFIESGGYIGMPVFRRFLVKTFSFMFSKILKVKLTDITCGLRVVNLKYWNSMQELVPQNSKYSGEQIITLKALYANYKLVELPVKIEYNLSLRPYSHLKFKHYFQIIIPWIEFILWKKSNYMITQPKWMKNVA